MTSGSRQGECRLPTCISRMQVGAICQSPSESADIARSGRIEEVFVMGIMQGTRNDCAAEQSNHHGSQQEPSHYPQFTRTEHFVS